MFSQFRENGRIIFYIKCVHAGSQRMQSLMEDNYHMFSVKNVTGNITLNIFNTPLMGNIQEYRVISSKTFTHPMDTLTMKIVNLTHLQCIKMIHLFCIKDKEP